MKLMFASDLHGDLAAAKRLLEIFREEGAERLVLLGDLLYHGPRNDLPRAYDPKGVIALLNDHRDRLLAVRGNCDTEVDQMVLAFPILADYAALPLPGGGIAYLTHGHRYHGACPPPMGARDILIHGHTHIAGVTYTEAGQAVLNPGSVSMPKGGTPAAYMVLEGDCFTIRTLADKAPYQAHKIG